MRFAFHLIKLPIALLIALRLSVACLAISQWVTVRSIAVRLVVVIAVLGLCACAESGVEEEAGQIVEDSAVLEAVVSDAVVSDAMFAGTMFQDSAVTDNGGANPLASQDVTSTEVPMDEMPIDVLPGSLTTNEPLPATVMASSTEIVPPSEVIQLPSAVVGLSLVRGIEIESSSALAGVSINVVEFGFIFTENPFIELRIDNHSAGAITYSSCEIKALKDNEIIDSTYTHFADDNPIDAGESAMDAGIWFGLSSFSSVDKISIQCEWREGNRDRRDIVNGPVIVEFANYSSSLGSPSVVVRLTNNSPFAIERADCGFEAKRGNVILDVASVFFNDLDIIRSGEAAQDEGVWFKLDSLNEFDAEPFNLANANCRYVVLSTDANTISEEATIETTADVPMLDEPVADESEARVPTLAELDLDGDGDVDCGDFTSQADAQRFFEANGPGDPHRLDGNNDGVVCVSLN